MRVSFLVFYPSCFAEWSWFMLDDFTWHAWTVPYLMAMDQWLGQMHQLAHQFKHVHQALWKPDGGTPLATKKSSPPRPRDPAIHQAFATFRDRSQQALGRSSGG